MQHKAFLEQSITASVIYVPSLVIAILLVNLIHGWNYGDRVVLNNLEFNGNLVTMLFMGFISIGLIKGVKFFNAQVQGSDPDIREYKRAFWQVLRGTFLLLTTTVVPFVVVNILTHHDATCDLVYISMVKGNSTHIIQV